MKPLDFRSKPYLLPVLALALAACGSDAPAGEGPAVRDPAAPTATHATPAEPRMEDGVQVVEIEAGPTGYTPAAVSLEADVPARLVFTRTVEGECSSQVQVPDFGVGPTDLPMNEPIPIEFTPSEGGDFTFVCGMDMQRGTLLVRS